MKNKTKPVVHQSLTSDGFHERQVKKQRKNVFFVILLVGLFFGGFFSVTNAADLTPEQQAAANQANYNASSVPSFQGINTGNTTNGEAVLNNDTRLHSYPTATPAQTTQAQPQNKKLKYTLLESFPGFFIGGTEMTDLPTMILAIYKFGIWTVGIAGLFMLVVGGFMYMASAGNTSTASSARGIITDSLIGIIAAMGAYLILYVINPDLTKINISFTPVEVVETLGFGEGGGNCSVPTTGPCTVEALQKTCFGSNAKAAAMVCGYESGGNVGSPSKSDKGADGNVFSWGLFQINLTQHSLGGFDCQSAFEGKNYKSKIINSAMYANCKSAATTAMTNINYACKISNNGTNWKPWINTKKACGL